jgi:lipopolysaccharide/colanic/teichoic acid biosynthesis glycosyltransferase
VLRISRPRVPGRAEQVARADASEEGENRQPRRPSKAALAVKRGIDIALSLGLGLISLPLMLLIALAIRFDSRGPILFRATRVGRHGKRFPMLKFRTMVEDAHERLQELSHLNVAHGMVKIPDDPRVTKIGKLLRRYSLDELPQILNVIVGHMSLVGPRPHDDYELAQIGLEHDPRLLLRPGLTGLWQVSARSDPSLATRLRHDFRYVSSWSLFLDAKILAKTVPAVVLGKGGFVDDVSATPGFENHSASFHAALVEGSDILAEADALAGSVSARPRST